MLIPLFLMMAIPTLFAPLSIAHLYQSEIEWQERQIHLDNTAISFGREVRSLLRNLVKGENELNGLHLKLHKAILCSSIPATAITCRALVTHLRTTILFKTWKIENQAKISWMLAKKKVDEQIFKYPKEFSHSVKTSPGIAKVFCSQCQLPRSWQVFSAKLRSSFWDERDNRRSVAVSFEKVPPTDQWNYRLWVKAFQR